MKTICKSRICGFFDGWHPNEVYHLQNGSKWQLVSPTVRVKWLQSPEATILQSGNRYFLKVKGMGKRQEVMPLGRVPVGPHPGPVPRANRDLPAWLARAFQCEIEQRRQAGYEASPGSPPESRSGW